jgi:predicted ArsR family transcriptional regulator
MRRIGGRPLSKASPSLSSLVKPGRYRDLILLELGKGPATASRLSARLQLDDEGVRQALRRLERRGLVWSLLAFAPSRHGRLMPYRLYFLAGMADGLPMPGRRKALTLTERAALEAVRESQVIHAEWLRRYEELGRHHDLLRRVERRARANGPGA